MARTVIDIDDDALRAAMAELGTTTKVATVNAALRRVISDAQRERALARLSEPGIFDELKDRDVLWR